MSAAGEGNRERQWVDSCAAWAAWPGASPQPGPDAPCGPKRVRVSRSRSGARERHSHYFAIVPLDEVERVYLDKIRFVPKAQQLTLLFRDRSHVTLEVGRKQKPGDIVTQVDQLLALRKPEPGS